MQVRWFRCKGELALVGSGQGQQVVDHGPHRLDLLVHARERLSCFGREAGLAQVDLQLRAHHREGRSELVRGVGDEATLIRDPTLQSLQHAVHRHGEVMDLVGGGRHVDAFIEMFDADLAGFVRDPRHGRQGGAREPPPAEPGDEQQAGSRQREQGPQSADGGVDRIERGGNDDDQLRGAGERHGQQAEGLCVRAQGHRPVNGVAPTNDRQVIGPDQRAFRRGVSRRLERGTAGIEQLRRRLASGKLSQGRVARVLKLPLIRGADTEGDLRRSRGKRGVDPGDQIGTQPDHDEGAERCHQDGEQGDGPDRDPQADREAHGVPTR